MCSKETCNFKEPTNRSHPIVDWLICYRDLKEGVPICYHITVEPQRCLPRTRPVYTNRDLLHGSCIRKETWCIRKETYCRQRFLRYNNYSLSYLKRCQRCLPQKRPVYANRDLYTKRNLCIPNETYSRQRCTRYITYCLFNHTSHEISAMLAAKETGVYRKRPVNEKRLMRTKRDQ